MNPLAYFRIFDNENCPCGSGKKFKECCKGKPDQEPAQSKKPPEVQVFLSVISRKFHIKFFSNALKKDRLFFNCLRW